MLEGTPELNKNDVSIEELKLFIESYRED